MLDARHFARLDTMPLADLKRSIDSHRASLPVLLAMGAPAADVGRLLDAMDAALAARPPAVKARIATSDTGHTAALYD